MDFVSEFEMLFSCQKNVEKFRNSQYYIDFMKHWQLPIYFQIRYIFYIIIIIIIIIRQ